MPSLHAWGTTSLPSLPLLKCRNSDKPVIFLQSAKSQWTSQKPAVKDTSSWPSYLCLYCPWLSLVGIYSCRSGGIPARAASSPCCPCPSQWVCWLCLSQHPCPPGSCPRAASQLGNKSDSQPHPCSLLNAGMQEKQDNSHTHTVAALGVTPRCPRPLLPRDRHFLLSCGIISLQRCLPKAQTPAGEMASRRCRGAPCPRLLPAESWAGRAGSAARLPEICLLSFIAPVDFAGAICARRDLHTDVPVRLRAESRLSSYFFFKPGPR